MFKSLKLLLIILFFMQISAVAETKKENEKAIFAGGCFWCMEHPFEEMDGVIEVISGYTGGHKKNPTYKEVSEGVTGHVEAVQIIYDPEKISYSQLLNIFWRQIDPTDSGGQFGDRGGQYKTAIFYLNEEQKKLAEKSKENLDKSGSFNKPIITDIKKAETFYAAEDYHQDYYKKNPLRYKVYRVGSGRDKFLKSTWADKEKRQVAATQRAAARPLTKFSSLCIRRSKKQELTAPKKNKFLHAKMSKDQLRKKLTDLQYKVTQENGTERPFENEYWDNKKKGIYVDIVSGEPLFSSTDKYDSKTGWPSFSKPLEPENIFEKTDRSFFTERTEVRSKYADSHLGHLFDDGPPVTGLRYCINSAALRFIPEEDLAKEGYKEYKKLF